MLKFTLSATMRSLELDAFLHSAPGDVLVVSKLSSVATREYVSALKYEKKAQDYRFLSALGITHVEIGGSDAEFSVKKCEMPDELTVQEGVGKLGNALSALEADKVIPSHLVDRILEFKGAERIHALHRVEQITFIVERFDAFKNRLASGEEIGDYANHYQTREEQLDTVYKILFGHSRPNDTYLDDFDLTKINFANLAPESPASAPWKLTISIEKTRDVLKLAIDNAENHMVGQFSPCLRRFRKLVDQLYNIYWTQVFEYSAYVAGSSSIEKDVPVLPDPPRGLTDHIRAVQGLRHQALKIYESFKIPFPSKENLLFHIYLHDPEQRGGRFTLGTSTPFRDINIAREFAGEKVIPSFREVPEFYFRHQLRDVVLFDRGEKILRRTLNSGRAMASFFSSDLESVKRDIRHDCAHVLLYRMGYRKIRSFFSGLQGSWLGYVEDILRKLANDQKREALFHQAELNAFLKTNVLILLNEMPNDEVVQKWRELVSNSRQSQKKRSSPQNQIGTEATP